MTPDQITRRFKILLIIAAIGWGCIILAVIANYFVTF
jgi:type III secretory pathway component EscR